MTREPVYQGPLLSPPTGDSCVSSTRGLLCLLHGALICLFHQGPPLSPPRSPHLSLPPGAFFGSSIRDSCVSYTRGLLCLLHVALICLFHQGPSLSPPSGVFSVSSIRSLLCIIHGVCSVSSTMILYCLQHQEFPLSPHATRSLLRSILCLLSSPLRPCFLHQEPLSVTFFTIKENLENLNKT